MLRENRELSVIVGFGVSDKNDLAVLDDVDSKRARTELAGSDIIVFDLLKKFRVDDDIQSAAIVDDDFC
jgi:hypothetical protein